MKGNAHKNLVAAVAAISILGVGLMPYASAGVVSSSDAMAIEASQTRTDNIVAFLERDDVARLLEQRGVAPSQVAARLQHLTAAELARLETAIDDDIAGGDALGVIGAVFLVLLILELVGVTDIFKSL